MADKREWERLILPHEVSTELLRQAVGLLGRTTAKVLDRPEAWTKGAWARDRQGTPVAITDPSASSWCVAAAVIRAAADSRALPDLGDPPLPLSEPTDLAAALSLLAAPALSLYAELYGPRCCVLDPGQWPRGSGTAALDATLIAAIVNDAERVEFPHVGALLGVTLALVMVELRERGALR